MLNVACLPLTETKEELTSEITSALKSSDTPSGDVELCSDDIKLKACETSLMVLGPVQKVYEDWFER